MKNSEVLRIQSELLNEIKELASKLSYEELRVVLNNLKEELVIKE